MINVEKSYVIVRDATIIEGYTITIYRETETAPKYVYLGYLPVDVRVS